MNPPPPATRIRSFSLILDDRKVSNTDDSRETKPQHAQLSPQKDRRGDVKLNAGKTKSESAPKGKGRNSMPLAQGICRKQRKTSIFSNYKRELHRDMVP